MYSFFYHQFINSSIQLSTLDTLYFSSEIQRASSVSTYKQQQPTTMYYNSTPQTSNTHSHTSLKKMLKKARTAMDHGELQVERILFGAALFPKDLEAETKRI